MHSRAETITVQMVGNLTRSDILWRCQLSVSLSWYCPDPEMGSRSPKPWEVFSIMEIIITWSLKGHTTIKPMRKTYTRDQKDFIPETSLKGSRWKLVLAPVYVQNNYWVLKIHQIRNLPPTHNSFKFQHPYDQVSLKLGQGHWNITCNILLSKIKAHKRFKRKLTLITQHKTCANVQGSPFFKQKAHNTDKQ